VIALTLATGLIVRTVAPVLERVPLWPRE